MISVIPNQSPGKEDQFNGRTVRRNSHELLSSDNRQVYKVTFHAQIFSKKSTRENNNDKYQDILDEEQKIREDIEADNVPDLERYRSLTGATISDDDLIANIIEDDNVPSEFILDATIIGLIKDYLNPRITVDWNTLNEKLKEINKYYPDNKYKGITRNNIGNYDTRRSTRRNEPVSQFQEDFIESGDEDDERTGKEKDKEEGKVPKRWDTYIDTYVNYSHCPSINNYVFVSADQMDSFINEQIMPECFNCPNPGKYEKYLRDGEVTSTWFCYACNYTKNKEKDECEICKVKDLDNYYHVNFLYFLLN